MRSLVLSVPVLVLTLALAPSSLAKGPLDASMEGPGLDEPIRFAGWSDPAAVQDPARMPLQSLAEAAGFFPAAFGTSFGTLSPKRPPGDLGPRYTVTYGLGGPEGDEEQLVQDVYPYAKPHPVTYMAPRQTFYETMKTSGGWFVADTALNAPPLAVVLRDAGLPREPPAGGDGSVPWGIIVGSLAAVAVVVALAGLAVRLGRRRPHPAV